MKKIVTIVTLAFTLLGISQENTKAPLSTFTRVNLGLHGLEITHELPISNSFVWENSFGVGMGSDAIGDDPSYTFSLDVPVPFITSELKYMYNRSKRINKGRSTLNNSGNYVGLQTKYSFGNSRFFDLNQTLLTELHWGIQRPLGKRFIFDMHLGIGYLSDFTFESATLSPTFGLRFGYKLF